MPHFVHSCAKHGRHACRSKMVKPDCLIAAECTANIQPSLYKLFDLLKSPRHYMAPYNHSCNKPEIYNVQHDTLTWCSILDAKIKPEPVPAAGERLASCNVRE